jgi:hypothetical protein
LRIWDFNRRYFARNIGTIQIKTNQKSNICFLSLLLLLKDVLRWADFRKDVKETSNLKQLAPTKQGACVKLKTLEPPPPMTYGGSSFRRLQRLQVAKEQQKQLKLKELVL